MQEDHSQWNDPAGLRAAARGQLGGDRALQNHGDDIWEIITYIGAEGEEFTLDDVVTQLCKDKGLAKRTAYNYTMSFLAYARTVPDQFSGPKSKLTRARRGVYYLADNPER